MKPIAFVIPWYGENIRGGAEAECNHLAHCLLNRGLQVEVLTTCVKESSADRGKNVLPEGNRIESGILVRRFLVKKQNKKKFDLINEKIFNNMSVSKAEEVIYLEEDINSPDMYEFINRNKEKYCAFFCMPYLYGLVYHAAKACLDKCILIPCLHNERYAYMQFMKELMSQVKGIVFLSKAEERLAYSIYNLETVKMAVLGAYIETGWEDKCQPNKFREKYNINDDFILYAGRKDSGKKVDELIRFFLGYKKKKAKVKLKLVLVGGGKINIPYEFQNDIIDLGFVSIEDKRNAFSAATIFCNPSYLESFSIVLMEAWLCETVALVSAHCEVTTDFCIENNSGLYYRDFMEFCGCLDYLLTHDKEKQLMQEKGRTFVLQNFIEEIIADKYQNFLLSVFD